MMKLMKNLAYYALSFASRCDQQTCECPHELWYLEMTVGELARVILNSDIV